MTTLNSIKLLEEIIEYLPCMLFAKSVKNDFRFILWNKQAEIIIGLTKEQAIGKNDYDFFPKEQGDFFRQKDLDTFTKKEIVDIPEEIIKSPTLGERWLHTWKVPIFDETGQPDILLGISVDITDAKKMQKDIEDQRLKLVNSAKLSALGEMAGGIAHEINNPLTVVQGWANRLKEAANNDVCSPEFVGTAASKIVETSGRIAKIISGLKAISRESSRDDIKDVSILEVVNETLEFCTERLKNREIELRKNFLVDKDFKVRAQSVQISQVILNLLNNAFDAVSEVKQKWIAIEILVVNAKLQIKISDSGVAIIDEVKDKLFQPFFTTKEVGKGTGLGLSISKNIMQQHKGDIYLDTDTKNTTFVVELPTN